MRFFYEETMEKNNYPRHIEHIFEFDVPPGQGIERLDVYLTRVIPNATRNKVQEAIAEGSVVVNGAKVKNSRKVLPGDHIVCTILKPPPMELIPEDIPLNIVFEDDRVIVVNKPAGMVVHPGFGNRYGTLVNALLFHLGMREGILIDDDDNSDNEQNDEDEVDFLSQDNSDEYRPGIVHRIDKDTSGVLVIAKDIESLAFLSKQFRDRTSEREYYALVWGLVKNDEGEIVSHIVRSPRDRKIFMATENTKLGKFAHTTYSVVERYDFCTLLKLKLKTGRTHQIRVHCASIGHPLMSDAAYGGAHVAYSGIKSGVMKSKAEELLRIIPRQALHAKSLGFVHPVSLQKMMFDSELPEDFAQAIHFCRLLSTI